MSSTTVLQTPTGLIESKLTHYPPDLGVFEGFVSGQNGWTDTSGDTGAAVAALDERGGGVSLTTGATDNNEVYLHRTQETLLFAQHKPLSIEAEYKFSEANTDDANIAIGAANAVGANTLVDDGAGMKSSYSGAVFLKKDGDLNWRVAVSIGTTETEVELTAANSYDKTAHLVAATSYRKLRIDWESITSTTGEARFFIDEGYGWVHVYSIRFTYTSATEMQPFAGVKAGGANSEVLYIKRLPHWQAR